jgi:hypothetical protein
MSLSDLYLGQNEDGEDSRKLKRQNQTSKARTAAQLTFQRRRLERSLKKTEEAEGDADQAAKASFQSEFLASSSTKWNPVEDVPDQGLGSADVGNGRRRAVFLYFRSFVIAVCNLFLQSSSPQNLREQEPHIRHVISININDDTNIKLGSGKRGSAEVRSVMKALLIGMTCQLLGFVCTSQWWLWSGLRLQTCMLNLCLGSFVFVGMLAGVFVHGACLAIFSRALSDKRCVL